MRTIRTVAGILDRRLGAGATGAHRSAAQEALEAMGELLDADLLAPLLDELAAEADSRQDAAAQRAGLSYRHALGFDKVMLLVGRPAYMLRAHVWRPRTAVAGPGPGGTTSPGGGTEHIHNHRFGFASAVLRGELRMRLYTAQGVQGGPDATGRAEWEAGTATEVTAYEEEVTAGDTEWLIRPVGSARLRMSADLSLTAGSRYCLDAGQPHQVVQSRGPGSATLFLETVALRSRTDVYTEPGRPAPASVVKRPLNLADYACELRRLSGLLA
ncbi:hypothetical protein [Streptomyces sp. NPDC026673]|uniref:hypothetical protein n=1 Tax=Streptomyces sp. NPDC026673 TaxID=3155724 RepID=UPI0033E27AEB